MRKHLFIHRTAVEGLSYFVLACLLTLVMFNICACKGKTGNAGDSAPITPVSTAPADATQCPTGGTVVTIGSTTYLSCSGSTGLTGATGSAGLQGVTGAAGTPGTVVTPIQLCPGTSTYPSTFIEYAICINNNLYGVYSANDGFLALLPPGVYYSDGINVSCTVTIGPNCTVRH